MSNISAWSTTAASNNAATPNGWPEGQSPSSVNDCAREMMAAVAKFYQDTDGGLVTAGTATAYTLTTSSTFTALGDISLLVFRVNQANSGAATLAVDGLTAKSMRIRGAALAANDLVANALVVASYNANQDVFDVHFSLPNNNASNLTSGSLPDARLSANVPLKNAANTFTAASQTFSRAGAINFNIDNSSDSINIDFGVDTSGGYLWTASAHPLSFGTNNAERLSINSSGNFDFNAGTVTTDNASASEVGFKGVPTSANSDPVLADAGKRITVSGGATSTIPANSSVAFPIGTVLTFVSTGAAGTIAITTDTMYLAGTAFGTTGSRTLASGGIATALKISATEWIISGNVS